MDIIYSPDHVLHHAAGELSGGQFVPPYECPERIAFILDRAAKVGLGKVVAPDEFGMDPVLRTHDAGLVDFLATAWSLWQNTGYPGEAVPTIWPARGMVQRRPNDIDGLLGYYSFAAETAIGPKSWEATLASKNVALTGAAQIKAGARAAFALCRPPGHHAHHDLYGGYCFLNNAAIATQWLRDQGAARIAILDVDFHHGNGTQDIFYDRSDVLFTSLHGDPVEAFPFFLGYADEIGRGAGEGFNHNYPMPRRTSFDVWGASLAHALDRIANFAPDALVVSLGVDTFEHDPISFFKLTSDDFSRYGEMIGKLGLQTLFVMEGGYAVDQIGINAVNVLTGFENA